MYKHGNVDIRALQAILGHESIATTEIYTHLDDEQLREAVNSNPYPLSLLPAMALAKARRKTVVIYNYLERIIQRELFEEHTISSVCGINISLACHLKG